jgi:hypothetical protein
MAREQENGLVSGNDLSGQKEIKDKTTLPIIDPETTDPETNKIQPATGQSESAAPKIVMAAGGSIMVAGVLFAIVGAPFLGPLSLAIGIPTALALGGTIVAAGIGMQVSQQNKNTAIANTPNAQLEKDATQELTLEQSKGNPIRGLENLLNSHDIYYGSNLYNEILRNTGFSTLGTDEQAQFVAKLTNEFKNTAITNNNGIDKTAVLDAAANAINGLTGDKNVAKWVAERMEEADKRLRNTIKDNPALQEALGFEPKNNRKDANNPAEPLLNFKTPEQQAKTLADALSNPDGNNQQPLLNFKAPVQNAAIAQGNEHASPNQAVQLELATEIVSVPSNALAQVNQPSSPNQAVQLELATEIVSVPSNALAQVNQPASPSPELNQAESLQLMTNNFAQSLDQSNATTTQMQDSMQNLALDIPQDLGSKKGQWGKKEENKDFTKGEAVEGKELESLLGLSGDANKEVQQIKNNKMEGVKSKGSDSNSILGGIPPSAIVKAPQTPMALAADRQANKVQ